jgi:hypothetical protein
VSHSGGGGSRKAQISWNTAYAGDAPISSYEILRDGEKIAGIPFTPQLSTDPYSYTDSVVDKMIHEYSVRVVDAKGRIAESEKVSF